MPDPLKHLTRQQVAAMHSSLARYADWVSAEKVNALMDDVKAAVDDILNPRTVIRDGVQVTEGMNPAEARARLTQLAESMDAASLVDRIDFMIQTATEVAQGAARLVIQNDPVQLDEYPALELHRVYGREVPRGFKRGGRGALIPVPDDDWPSRWRAAAQAAGDSDAARVLQESGRMVALKSSGIWQQLGDGAGGHDDTLGNPFPPFAFNSGFDVDEIDREETESLGLLTPGAQAHAAPVNFTNLFALPEAA